jgi:WD40 repeat protein
VSTWEALIAGRAREAERAQRFAAQKERDNAQSAQRRAEYNLYASEMNLASQAVESHDLERAEELLSHYRPNPAPSRTVSKSSSDCLGWEWRLLKAQCRSDERSTLGTHNTGVKAVAFASDGKVAASGDDAGVLRLWDWPNSRVIAEMPGHAASISNLRFIPTRRAFISAGEDKCIRVWSMDSLRPIIGWTNQAGRIASMAVSPDGRLVAGGGVNRASAFGTLSPGRSSWN